MKEYETICIFRPGVSEEDVRDLTGRIDKVIRENNGEVLLNNSLGKKPLAFSISKEKEGVFHAVSFAGQGPLVSKLENGLRFDERVLRYMTHVVSEDFDRKQRIEKKEGTKNEEN